MLEGGRLGLNSFFRVEQALVRGGAGGGVSCSLQRFSPVVELNTHSGSRRQEVAVACLELGRCSARGQWGSEGVANWQVGTTDVPHRSSN